MNTRVAALINEIGVPAIAVGTALGFALLNFAESIAYLIVALANPLPGIPSEASGDASLGTKLALLSLFSEPGFGISVGGRPLAVAPLISAVLEILLILAAVAWIWPRLEREPHP